MRPRDISPFFDSLVFQVRVDKDLRLELRLVHLSHQCAVLEVIGPPEFMGNRIGLPHVPYFGMPSINGYHHRHSCTFKFFAAVHREARDWYQKRCALERREQEIRQYIDLGLTEDDLRGWIETETGLFFHRSELQEIRSGIQ